MGKIIDITGQRFGYLTVLYPSRINGRFAWHCKCDCGKEIDVDSNNLRKGKVKSCGCQTSKLISEKLIKDLTGKRFGYLIVLEKTEKRDSGGVVWKCKCDCGNICYIPTSNLNRNHTRSCGCKTGEMISEKKKLHLIGQRFGKLEVKEELPSINGESKWKCQCDCGNVIEATGWHLTKGIVSSCGCLRSKGEAKIKKILSENNIPFTSQKTFSTCVSPNNVPLRFDFYINDKYLLEYDGEQHFFPGNEKSGWNSKDNFELRKKYDEIKNKWCIDNNIPLIRIPYTKLDSLTLEDLLLEEEK